MPAILCLLSPHAWITIGAGVTCFLIVVMLLVVVLLIAKRYLVKSGSVTVTINNDRKVETAAGVSLLSAMAQRNVFLPSACGGKGSCGQCRVQVREGGGQILPTETVHFSRKEIKDDWRLACQVKVKGDMDIEVPASVLDVREWECEVISNRNVATFIKEFIVALPPGEHMDFIPGSYAQIKIPPFEMDYAKDIDRSLIGDEYLPAWEKFGLFGLRCRNTETTVRAYSMANYPAEGDRIMLTVRIATPPMKPKPQTGFQDVMPGIASSYIFSLKPGDKVMMSGPYGDFHPIFDSGAEMMWVGGGAGMAPLRAQIMHMTHTLRTTDRKMNFFYGARAERGVLPRRFPASGEGVPQLQIPSCPRPTGPCRRCSGCGIHPRFRASGNAGHLSQGPSSSRGYRILHVRSRPDERGGEQNARLAGR